MTTVPQVFASTVERLGNRTALRDKTLGLWRDISWNEYLDQASLIGLGLMCLGMDKGDAISIIGDNCPEWVMIDMGVQCLGGVSVGIYTTNSWKQVEYIVNHSDSRYLFVENEEQLDKWLEFRESAPRLEKIIVWDLTGIRHFHDPVVMSLEDLVRLGQERAAENPGLLQEQMARVTPDDLSMLIYTSGTTGQPKGAMLTHRNVTWMAAAVGEAIALYETDEVLSFLPLCHIFERLFSVFIHITHGYIVNFVESPETVPDNLKEISPTLGYAVPRVWEKYHALITIRMAEATWFKRMVFGLALKTGFTHLDHAAKNGGAPRRLRLGHSLADFAVFRKLRERLGFDRMRLAISGAAPISPDVLRFFHVIGVNLLEGYGQTEGSGVTTVGRIGRAKLGTVGVPLPGLEVRIADDGEILVKSPGVFVGYLKSPEATKEALEEGWLHSGDVGEVDDEGFLKIIDRKKDILITAGGKNIAPQFIENRLKFNPYINDAVVIGDRRKFLTALVVLDEEHVISYTRTHKIQFATYADLAQHPLINNLIKDEVDAVNKGLARVEQIRKFRIIPKKFYEEDGEVTPTMKVKRKHVSEGYGDLIESMYRE